jgi:hypothetical protein
MKGGRCRHRERRRIIRPVAPAEHPPKQTTARWCDQGTVERSADTGGFVAAGRSNRTPKTPDHRRFPPLSIRPTGDNSILHLLIIYWWQSPQQSPGTGLKMVVVESITKDMFVGDDGCEPNSIGLQHYR